MPKMSPESCVENHHRYVTMWAKRCPVNRGWYVEVQAHEDAGDDVRQLHRWSCESGPFDDPLAVIDLAVPELREALMALLLAE